MEEKKDKNILEQIEAEADETIHPFLEFIVKNIKKIGIILGSVVLIVAIYSAYKYYNFSQIEKAKKELGMILVSSKDKEKDLVSFLERAPKELYPSIYAELVSLYWNKNELDKAYSILDKLKELDEDLSIVCILSQVNILMDKKEYEKGYSLLENINLKDFENYKKEILFKKAFLLEKLGKFKDAYNYYVELKKEFKGGDTTYLDAKINRLKEKI